MGFKNCWKNRIKDRLVKQKAKKDKPHTLPFEEIRQILSQLSEQEKEMLFLEIREDLQSSSETIAYAEKIFHHFSSLYLKRFPTLDQISVLELGPGVNLAAGIYFALAGVGRYTAVDALAAFPERPKEFYRNVLEEIRDRPRLVGKNYLSQDDLDHIVKVGEQVEWNREKVQYLTPIYAESMPFHDETFDYIFSNASFEHFEKPDHVIREVHRTLKRDGLTIHDIDLRDHIDFSKPREFLKAPPDSYTYSSPYGTNRWRACDFEEAFAAAGFVIHELNIDDSQEVSEQEYESFDPYFRERYTRTQLEPLSILVVASKK